MEKQTKKTEKAENAESKRAEKSKSVSGKQTEAISPSTESKKNNISPSVGPAAENTKDDDKGSLVIGIIAVIIIFALFALAISAVGRANRQTVGELRGETVTRLGQTGTISYELGEEAEIVEGTPITWYIDGRKVAESKFVKGGEVKLEYSPSHTGVEKIRVDIGKKFTQTKVVNVGKPLVTLSARNVTITYGDAIPEFLYDCNGFIDGDTADVLKYDGKACLNCDRLSAGIYTISFDKRCDNDKYDTETVTGTLTVLPKELKLSESFVKIYDGTNYVCPQAMSLEGIIEGDEVSAECEKLYFTDKNVGKDKTVTTANVSLTGKDSANYFLCNEGAKGEIVPKVLTLGTLIVENKAYDGNTKAAVRNVGRINGLVEGDSVAIGSLSARFTDASVGSGKKVVIENVTLVGYDKDNYVLLGGAEGKADITQNFLDKLFDKHDAVRGAK